MLVDGEVQESTRLWTKVEVDRFQVNYSNNDSFPNLHSSLIGWTMSYSVLQYLFYIVVQ